MPTAWLRHNHRARPSPRPSIAKATVGACAGLASSRRTTNPSRPIAGQPLRVDNRDDADLAVVYHENDRAWEAGHEGPAGPFIETVECKRTKALLRFAADLVGCVERLSAESLALILVPGRPRRTVRRWPRAR